MLSPMHDRISDNLTLHMRATLHCNSARDLNLFDLASPCPVPPTPRQCYGRAQTMPGGTDTMAQRARLHVGEYGRPRGQPTSHCTDM